MRMNIGKLNIRKEIYNRNTGVHYIEYRDKNKLIDILNYAEELNIFDKYNMEYQCIFDKDFIVLVLIEQIEYLNQKQKNIKGDLNYA